MSLSDIVSNADLAFWAEAALLIFFLAFLGIVAYVFIRRRDSWDRTRHLPLEDDPRSGSLEDQPR